MAGEREGGAGGRDGREEGGKRWEGREGWLYSVTYFRTAAQFRCRCQNHNLAFALETRAL